MGCGAGKAKRISEAPVTSVSPDRHMLLHNMAEETKEKANSLTIIHFNDVYNIEPRDREPVGGAARFKTKIKELAWKNPLVLFSGDALSPSQISSFTKGEQMVPILNALDVNTAVFGNHDFDFGVENLVNIAKSTKFPWLMSNVVDKMTNRPLGEGLVKRIITWDGRKIGLIGLVEYEWLVTLSTISPEDVDYTDYVECAQVFVPQLIAEGCDLVIALTHMRMPNDTRLAESVDGIDIILGGHDHLYEVKKVNDIHIVKSGSDFKEFSEIIIKFSVDKPSYTIRRHEITSDLPENEEVAAIVSKYLGQTEKSMSEVIGHVYCTLEGRFTHVRTRETNLGNLIADIACAANKADCAIINSGTFRSDIVHNVGVFKLKDLFSILPGVDPLVVLSISGGDLLKALENGVSQYPKLEGRFPQVSGLKFSFDPSLPCGDRIISESVYVAGEILQPNKIYKLCTKEYLAEGKDGYDILKMQKRLLGMEEGPILFTVVRNFFTDVANQKSLRRLSSRNNLMNVFSNCNKPVSDEVSNSNVKFGALRIKPEVEGRINLIVKQHDNNNPVTSASLGTLSEEDSST